MSLASFKSSISRLSIRPELLTRGRHVEGKFFGYQKSFVMSNFKVKKWAEQRGYSEEYLNELIEKGTMRRILSSGVKGSGYVWYDRKTGWKRTVSKRTGVLAIKVGMKQEKDWWGEAHPVTVLQLQDNVVCVNYHDPQVLYIFLLF